MAEEVVGGIAVKMRGHRLWMEQMLSTLAAAPSLCLELVVDEDQ